MKSLKLTNTEIQQLTRIIKTYYPTQFLFIKDDKRTQFIVVKNLIDFSKFKVEIHWLEFVLCYIIPKYSDDLFKRKVEDLTIQRQNQGDFLYKYSRGENIIRSLYDKMFNNK